MDYEKLTKQELVAIINGLNAELEVTKNEVLSIKSKAENFPLKEKQIREEMNVIHRKEIEVLNNKINKIVEDTKKIHGSALQNEKGVLEYESIVSMYEGIIRIQKENINFLEGNIVNMVNKKRSEFVFYEEENKEESKGE